MNNWDYVPFADCITKVESTPQINRKDFLENGSFPIVSQEKGLTNGFWNIESDLFKIERPLVIFGDHTRVIKYIDFDFVKGADGIKILKPINSIHPKYFYYCLLAFPVKGLGYARHYRLLKELNIPIAPLQEQERIVAVLDEAFEAIDTAIANTEKNLSNTEELFQSILNRQFNMSEDLRSEWEVLTVDDVCTLINGKAYKKAELLDSGKYKVLRVGNFFTSNKWYYSDLELEDTKYCDAGDLLYAWSASFGPKIWDGEKTIYHYHIWRVDIDESLIKKAFLYHWFNWDKENIKRDQGAGTTMIHVSMKSMKGREIVVPSLNEQERIVSILDEANDSVQALRDGLLLKLAGLEELKQSVLDKAFAGELTDSVLEEAGV